jgi:hypothetical protein
MELVGCWPSSKRRSKGGVADRDFLCSHSEAEDLCSPVVDETVLQGLNRLRKEGFDERAVKPNIDFIGFAGTTKVMP